MRAILSEQFLAMRLIRLTIALLVAGSFALNAAVNRDERRDTTLVSERNGAPHGPLVPGPDDGKIAEVTGAFLERGHYSQQPLDDSVSSKFLDRYLDALDPAHLIFLQSDLAEFEKWRTELDD